MIMEKGDCKREKQSFLQRAKGKIVVGASVLAIGTGALIAGCASPENGEGEQLSEAAKSALVINGVRDQVAGDVKKTVKRLGDVSTPPWECSPVPMNFGEPNPFGGGINSVKTLEDSDGKTYALISGARLIDDDLDIFYSYPSVNEEGKWEDPQPINDLNTPRPEYDFAVGDSSIYVADGSSTLKEYNWDHDPSTFPAQSSTPAISSVVNLNIHNQYLYYSGKPGLGVHRTNINNPTEDTQQCPVHWKSWGVDVGKDFAIVAATCTDIEGELYDCNNESNLFIYPFAIDGSSGVENWGEGSNLSELLGLGFNTVGSPYIDTKTGNFYFTAGAGDSSMSAYECTPNPADGYCLGTNDSVADCCFEHLEDCVGQGCSTDTYANPLCEGTTADEVVVDNATADEGGGDTAIADDPADTSEDVIENTDIVEADTTVPDTTVTDTNDVGSDTNDEVTDSAVDTTIPDNGTDTNIPKLNFEIATEDCVVEVIDSNTASITTETTDDSCTFEMNVKKPGTTPAEITLSSNETCPEAVVECAKEGCAIVCGDLKVDDNGQGISTKPYGSEDVTTGIVGTEYNVSLIDNSAEGNGKTFQADIDKGCMWYEIASTQEKIYLGDLLFACQKENKDLKEEDIYTRVIIELNNDGNVTNVTKEKVEIVEGAEGAEVAEVAESTDVAEVAKDTTTVEGAEIVEATNKGGGGCSTSSSSEKGNKGTLVLLMATAIAALLARKRISFKK